MTGLHCGFHGGVAGIESLVPDNRKEIFLPITSLFFNTLLSF